MGDNPYRVSSFVNRLIEALLQPLLDPLALRHFFADQRLIKGLSVIDVAQNCKMRLPVGHLDFYL